MNGPTQGRVAGWRVDELFDLREQTSLVGRALVMIDNKAGALQELVEGDDLRPPDVSAVELGRLATRALLERARLEPEQVDQVIFGNVALPADAANIARVIALRAGIPQERIALRPARPRDSARLLLVEGSEISDHQVLELPDLLRAVS